MENMRIKNIERFFLNTILKIVIGGVFIILVSDILLYPEDTLSIYISAIILGTCIFAYLIRNHYPTISVVTLSTVALAAMSYQRLTVPNTSITLSVVLIVGFIFSIMLKGKIMWIMHGIAFLIINTIFVFHLPDAVTAAVTYSILYFILTYATRELKLNYDKIHQHLRENNIKLHEKANEIEAQNEELVHIQDNLNSLNGDLEKIVNERTAKIQIQNDILIRYSFTNAHHLRGPVARMLGLGSLYKIDCDLSPDFLIEKMLDQAREIDLVINQINIDLDSVDKN